MTASDFHSVFTGMAEARSPRYAPRPAQVMMMTSALVRGGAQRRMAATAAGLMERGVHVCLIASRPAHPGDIDFLPDLYALGIEADIAPQEPLAPATALSLEIEAELHALEISLPVWWFVDLARPFARAILEDRPTVVHGWVDRFAIVAGLVACTLGVPRIIIGLTSTTPEKRGFEDADLLRIGFQALASHKNVSFVSVSQQCADEHEAWLGLPKGRIKTIYAGMLPGVVRIPSQDELKAYREALGIAKETHVVGTVMRFDDVKDPALWIETAREIAKMRPDTYFLMAGSGIREDWIKREIDSVGLRNHVVMPGASLDIGLSYAAMDVFLMTSKAEGLGNTLIEAQAAGRCVVSVDVGGVREAILSEITGMVVEDRSAHSLSRTVVRLLDDADWRERAAREGPRFVSERFGYDRMVAETMQVYASQDCMTDQNVGS